MLAQNFCKIILIDLILALDNFLSDSAWYKGPFSMLDVTYTLTLCQHNQIKTGILRPLWLQIKYDKYLFRSVFIINYFFIKHVKRIFTKTYLYNLDPVKPHFYTVKVEFTGVYIIISYFYAKTDVGTH